MTLNEFLKQHDGEIDVLEVVDLDDVEMENVPGRAKVIAYSAEAGFFSVMVDPMIPAKIRGPVPLCRNCTRRSAQ